MSIKRIDYIDEIRGIAILLVVIGHIIQFNGISKNNSVFEFIYSFHMPLFFAISGYITQKVTHITNAKQYKSFIKKKFIALIIPLLTWSLIVNNFFLKEGWNTLHWSDIQNVLISPGLWFLQVLFVILCFYGIFNWINSKISLNPIINFLISILPVISLSFFTIYIKFMGIYLALYSIAFYIGVILSKYIFVEKLCTKTITYAIAIIVFMVLSTHWTFNGNYIDDILKITISATAFIVLLNLFTRIELSISIKHYLQLLGKYSLAIYVIQFYLCRFSSQQIEINENTINPIILFIITTIIAIPICYICVAIAKMIETNKLLNFLMLGKRIYKN